MNVKYRIVQPSGDIVHVHEVGDVIRDETGNIVRESGIIQDITQTVVTEERLKQTLSDAHRAERLAQLGSYVWKWDRDGGYLEDCTEEYARLLGMMKSEALASFNTLAADHGVIHPEDRDEIVNAFKPGSDNDVIEGIENRCESKNGSYRWLRWRAQLERKLCAAF